MMIMIRTIVIIAMMVMMTKIIMMRRPDLRRSELDYHDIYDDDDDQIRSDDLCWYVFMSNKIFLFF